jgi:hypothetical protein
MTTGGAFLFPPPRNENHVLPAIEKSFRYLLKAVLIRLISLSAKEAFALSEVPSK